MVSFRKQNKQTKFSRNYPFKFKWKQLSFVCSYDNDDDDDDEIIVIVITKKKKRNITTDYYY